MIRTTELTTWLKLIVISLAGLMVACGGGGGSSAPESVTSITGSVVAAPVNGASITVTDANGNTVAGPVTTNSDGTYSIDLPDSALSGELSFESSGGTFDDEATGMLGKTAGTLAAYLAGSSLSAGSAVHLTPASTIVQNLVANHGKSLSEAKAAFKAAFGFDADTSIAPTDATNPKAGATQAELLAGLRAAAFSQLNMELLLDVVDQFELLSALATDIADGLFDGLNAGSTISVAAKKLPANIRFRFFWAMLNFHGGSKNQTNVAKSDLGEMPFIAGYVAGAAAGVEVAITSEGVSIATATTNSDGMYVIDTAGINLPSDVPLIFEASDGGTFVRTAWLAAGSVSVSAGSSVSLTPASSIVEKLVTTHAIDPVVAHANVKTAFNFDPDTTIAPTDINNPRAGAEKAELLAGLRAAAFEQLATDLGMTIDAILAALFDDIAFDGVLDGQGATNPEDIQNRFTQALLAKHNATMGATGLTNDQIGILPFAKLALTASYKVEYMPTSAMMNEQVGKTTFTLRISNVADSTAATGLSVSLMPMMHMATMSHASPVDGCTESTTLGEYDCTVYYLMATSMGDMSMGYWELMVMLDMSNSTVFYPTVEMAMGDTAKAELKGQADMIEMNMDGMLMAMPRSYYLFKDGLTAELDGTHTFDLFIAAKENMMSFPALSSPMTLRGSMDPENTSYDLAVTAVIVEVSVNETDWFTVTSNGSGHWTASGISGLTDTLHIRLTVEGTDINELKVTDTSDYATFQVTP